MISSICSLWRKVTCCLKGKKPIPRSLYLLPKRRGRIYSQLRLALNEDIMQMDTIFVAKDIGSVAAVPIERYLLILPQLAVRQYFIPLQRGGQLHF
jgi:hypothetical protein